MEFGILPKNYVAFPNLEEAMRGYDVPMGNPTPPRGDSDPGIRNQIFNPMFRNDDARYKLDVGFITANTQIKVGSFWKGIQQHNFFKRASHLGGFIFIGNSLDIAAAKIIMNVFGTDDEFWSLTVSVLRSCSLFRLLLVQMFCIREMPAYLSFLFF